MQVGEIYTRAGDRERGLTSLERAIALLEQASSDFIEMNCLRTARTFTVLNAMNDTHIGRLGHKPLDHAYALIGQCEGIVYKTPHAH